MPHPLLPEQWNLGDAKSSIMYLVWQQMQEQNELLREQNELLRSLVGNKPKTRGQKEES